MGRTWHVSMGGLQEDSDCMSSPGWGPEETFGRGKALGDGAGAAEHSLASLRAAGPPNGKEQTQMPRQEEVHPSLGLE